MATSPATRTAKGGWSGLEKGALAATAVSFVGLIAGIIGRAAGAKGFSGHDNDTSVLSNVFFGVLVLGLVAAVITGAAAWWVGRRTGRRSATVTAAIVLSYLVVAVAVAAALN